MNQTLADRWAQLEPHVQAFGPDDGSVRPAVLLFHGCGGLRAHLPRYAQAAVAAGFRAYIIDSYAPRGWGRELALSMVCTGILLRGVERAGDVLAALWGVGQRPEVDADRLAMAGWSHGGWSIMDLMTLGLNQPGDAYLADPTPAPLEGVRAVACFYAYVGPGALSRVRPWLRKPRTLAVSARRDHLTTLGAANRLWDRIEDGGVPVQRWVAEGTHAFDEPTGLPPMRHDPVLAAEAERRFAEFLKAALA
ncbi:dienelactone hydrolase [Brevundimonas sp. 2R-24]|uniref:Dienelactone hydrolase n=1 Tax=Peiella sedimenti TaxID=3061083 RepID=A0ABT8SKP0_9CAUL|nr:dienelactone hydrolase [Caulobacteraceae bacterium XZ-24]